MKLYKLVVTTSCAGLTLVMTTGSVEAANKTKPNVIVYMADDISAREFPIYGSTVWSDLKGQDSSEMKYRAKMPVMDRIAGEGIFVKTAWGATICSPSRAMMMTGRYAHLHKWWHNGDQGKWINPKSNRKETWPLYESSSLMMGHLAQKAGYGTYWAGKTQVPGDIQRHGFDEACLTPGNWGDMDNPYADFKLNFKKGPNGKDLKNSRGRKRVWSLDSGKEIPNLYKQHSWNFFPHVRVMNDPNSKKKMDWWPNTDKERKEFGVHTYGADVEIEHIFDFMDRQQKKKKPFFIYHTPRLGHDGFDFLHPESGNKWPGTPIANWDGKKYNRVKTKITGDKGVYDTHNTVSSPGMHSHMNYLDYQIWLYIQKLEKMGVMDNTILIITADNGTHGYGKGSEHLQRGPHVPFVVYAPGFNLTKKGLQDIVVNLADVYPTVADIVGTKIPADYEVNGKSLWPYLTTNANSHRDWIYSYKKHMQFIRGKYVMKDGRGNWWDVSSNPDDLISFKKVKDWEKMPPEHRAERKQFTKVMKSFDLYGVERHHPSVKTKKIKKNK